MTGKRTYILWLIGVLMVFLFVFPWGHGQSESDGDLVVTTVRRGELEVSIHTVGLLDAAKSHMVSSKIRGNKGKIIFLVRDGSWVEQDTVLVRLDPTRLRKKCIGSRARWIV